MIEIVFDTAAIRELNEADDWYAGISPVLRDRFLQEVFTVVDQIKAHPQMFRKVADRLRRANLSHFPYYLIYAIREDSISVLAVAHAKRRPGHWHPRISGSDFRD